MFFANDLILNPENYEEAYKKLREEILNYFALIEEYLNITAQRSSVVSINSALISSLSKYKKIFSDFLHSIAMFIKFRNKIQIKGRSIIAKNNIVERLNYYFNFQDIQAVEQIVEKIEFQNDSNIPKQVLTEFHNFMSHVCTAYSLSNEDKNTDVFSKNIERAINHIKRGTLDCYKIIIKDFFILMKNNKEEYLMIPKDEYKLFNIRINEYQSLGKEDMEVIENYKKYAAFILNKIT
ncbi:hypothetical protein [Campylobacter molothri]|uniref:hypothetical protein n=1 Tax=Campylobacter molothri TaxID=1032242 RepID=UPI001EFB841B|nr:hypothetical protein [Campylobacter sp. RM10537]